MGGVDGHDMDAIAVSMESGLEDRNNANPAPSRSANSLVSMESGLEDRNNDPP